MQNLVPLRKSIPFTTCVVQHLKLWQYWIRVIRIRYLGCMYESKRFLCRLNECSWRHIAIQILYVRPFVRASVRPLKFRLTFFKLLLFEQVRFNYNQTWIIGALWEPSHYDALGGHMTRSKVICGQIVIVISVNLFQIVPVRTGSLQLQPNLVHRCTMGTFSLWRSSRSHDKVKGHWRSNCYSYFS